MRIVEVINKTRNGEALTTAEIHRLIAGFVAGDVADYQMAAWAMAVCIQGLSPRETADLTMAMVESGDQLTWSEIAGRKVDKHSTGGVGDKTTLVVAPLVAAAGVPVVKMSGRGLGHTGGTLDKLEAIPGLSVSLDRSSFLHQMNEIGVAIAGQTARLVPADALLYALRDVTATVDSLPLIASSIMSKKIAGGADAIVLDVKVGSGAFMQTEPEARALAEAMVAIGSELGRETVALITQMDQPLGYAIGNAIEVNEAVQTLRGQGPADLTELSLALASEMIVLAGLATEVAVAKDRLTTLLTQGAAYDKFLEMVAAQGGSRDAMVAGLPLAPTELVVPAVRSGFVSHIQARQVGLAAALLGAGRNRKEDVIDPAVGIVLHQKVGDRVQTGSPLATVYAAHADQADQAAAVLQQAYSIEDNASPRLPLLLARVDANGWQRLT